MSRSTIEVDAQLERYIREVALRESELKEQLRRETGEMAMGEMQISPEQGQMMTLLAEIVGVDRALEVGTFTGYSAWCIADAMPKHGQLIACDVNEEWTSIAREYWEKAGIDDLIELHLRPAVETLEALLDAGEREAFDFAFIDADKENYDTYYEKCLELLRPGGVICVDNTLWSGSVADPDDDRASTEAIRALNAKMGSDDRITMSLIPIGDGCTVARKR